MKHSSLPHEFWDEAVYTATYLVNRMPTPILNYKSLYQLVFHREPDYQFLRNFGYECYPYLRHYLTTKLDSRSEWCVFIGYNTFHHGYQYLCLTFGCIYISRDVVFNEGIYPYAEKLGSFSFTQPSNRLMGSHPVELPIIHINPLLTTKPNLFSLVNSFSPGNFDLPPSSSTNSITLNSLLPHSPPILISPLGHIPSNNPLSPSNLDHQSTPTHVKTKSITDILKSLDSTQATTSIRHLLPTYLTTTISQHSDPLNFSIASKQHNWVKAMPEKY